MDLSDDMQVGPEHARSIMNRLGNQGIPFLFVIDFEMHHPWIRPLSAIHPEEVLYDINGMCNTPEVFGPLRKEPYFEKFPISLDAYSAKFNVVREHILAGNSFLVNLTCQTPVSLNLTLKEIFMHSQARYKLWFRDAFVVFSPESFVQIKNGRIASFPMKGTIDASIPGAKEHILSDFKERAEHYTIVDLIRNDLSMAASQVSVEALRYVEEVSAQSIKLLQVSSRIAGQLPSDYRSRLGDILFQLLPAGSICGAPKAKTLEIIRQAEAYERGYYTGIVGIFDGQDLDCGVMIRFIERTPEGFVFKSGGGITAFSEAEKEYQEMIDKVYLPVICAPASKPYVWKG